MPQQHPDYQKLIFIIGDSDCVEERELASYLYHRLRYHGLPSWGYPDVAVGGAGFTLNSLKRASPVVALISQHWSKGKGYEIDTALSLGREIVLGLIGDIEVPTNLGSCLAIDFRSNWEQGFSRLLTNLQEREYPGLLPVDGMRAIEAGNHVLRQIEGNVKQPNELVPRLYLRALCDTSNSDARSKSIRILAELRTFEGAILAALSDDPVEVVRSEAALALIRYGNERTKIALRLASIRDSSLAVRLYANVALSAYESPEAFIRSIEQLEANNSRPNLREVLKYLQERLPEVVANAPGMPRHIFISYARRDSEEFALKLASDLRQEGLHVWIDTNLEPGTEVWMDEIAKAIREAAVCLVILSPQIHTSTWVAREIQYARQFQKKIIPIEHLETEKPLYLATDQGLRGDPSFSDDYALQLKELVSVLTRHVN